MRRVLASTGGQITLLYTSWRMATRLAAMHGWKDPILAAAEQWKREASDLGAAAAGSGKPTPFGTPGTTLAGHEAARLADHIEQGLPDIPGQDALGWKVCSTIDLPGWAERHVGRRYLRVIRPGARVSPVEYFSGESKRRLHRLLRVLRGGEVVVTALPDVVEDA